MFSIPAVPNPHKRHYEQTTRTMAKTELPAMEQPASEPASSNFRLLDSLPTKRAEEMLEWLIETDMLLLMRASQKHRQAVLKFYESRMKPRRLFWHSEPNGLSYPDSIKWSIITGSLQIEPAGCLNGRMDWARYTAKLRPLGPGLSWPGHSWPGPVNSSENSTRPLNGPEWEIDTLQKCTSDGETIYSATLVPTGPKANHPAYLYRNPMNRLDRYIPTDRAGLEYLAAKKIHDPLTRRIGQVQGLSVAKAEEFIALQQQLIAKEMAGHTLSPAQREALKNPLFAEHVECGRIDLPKALELAENEINLFYCVSLLPLFRSGAIKLSEVSRMSEAGIRVLHDPRLVQLFHKGVLSKAQLMSLTQTQFQSISILYRSLLTRQVSSQTALAWSAAQLAEFHKAGVVEWLATGAMIPDCGAVRAASPKPTGTGTGKMAFTGLEVLLGPWPSREMCKAFYDKSGKLDVEWRNVLALPHQVL